MRTRYDQLSKALLEDALAVVGRATRQQEIADEPQMVDLWFIPRRRDRALLAGRGLLGRMVAGPSPGLLEPFHQPPRMDEVRACIRKQLVLHAGRLRQARRLGRCRPRFPVLWIISAGRPERVLQEYAFSGMTGWPPGFWMRQPADALRLVVVSELPRERDTLLLRLMGSGRVQEDALAELEGLPEDAWEHEVATENVVAFRARLPKNGTDEERRFMLNTNGIYEKWVKKHRAEGQKEGQKLGQRKSLKRSIRRLYVARFGPMPEALLAGVKAEDSVTQLDRWLLHVGTCTEEEIAAMLTAGR